MSQNNRALRSNPNTFAEDKDEFGVIIKSSQNNRALRSNPNIICSKNRHRFIISHKITEPYAQIPTHYNFIYAAMAAGMSQNNRALRSNPNSYTCSAGIFYLCHKITEPYAQIPTN